MRSHLQKAKRVYREEGRDALIRKGVPYVMRKIKKPYIRLRKRGTYQETRSQGTAKRWRLIQEELDESDESVVDIGCNAGKLTINTAQKGLLSLGVDIPSSEAITEAIEKSKQTENVAFMRAQVSPDNINYFTNFDVVFLLSVYHHWWRQFGKESAKAMLQSFHGANKIFFEPPSKQSKYTAYDEDEYDQSPPPITDFDDETIIEYNHSYLQDIFGEDYDVVHLGSTSRGEVRKGDRHLFLIEHNQS